MSDEEKTEEVERNLGMGMGRLRDWAAKRRQAWEDCFPMTVAKLEYGDTPVFSPDRTCKTGQMVCVRPVPTIDPQERTFIGFYLGDLNGGFHAQYKPETQVLTVSRAGGNPAIFVPDLNRIVMGYESWWGEIESEEDLKQITDQDISNVWYVKAMKELAAAHDPDSTEEEQGRASPK